jgi:hypothetical protein
MFNEIIKRYNSGLVKVRTFESPIIKRDRQKRITERGKSSHMEQNLISSLNRTKQKVIDLALSNNWDYFVTLTFNPDNLEYDLGSNEFKDGFTCISPNVQDRYYDDLSRRVTQWLNNIRKRKCKDMKYIIVPEYHLSHRIHFHGLFSNISELTMTDSHKKDKASRTIFNLEEFTLGFTDCTLVDNQVGSVLYISKYYSKELISVTFNKKRYWRSRNLETPNVIRQYTWYNHGWVDVPEYDNNYLSKYNKDIDIVVGTGIDRFNLYQQVNDYILEESNVDIPPSVQAAIELFGDVNVIKEDY